MEHAKAHWDSFHINEQTVNNQVNRFMTQSKSNDEIKRNLISM